MKRSIVTVPAILTGVKTRKDRSIKIEFDTAYEMSGEDAARLFSLHQSQGWLAFSPQDDITTKDIPEIKADAGIKEKSPSQRLRAVLHVYWQQKGGDKTWEQFYLEQMDRLVEIVKDKLEPEE